MRHEPVRLKHKRIRCPRCFAFSTKIGELAKGLQIRKCQSCKKEFCYDYSYEYLSQLRYNWNMKI